MRPILFSIGPYDVWVSPIFAGLSAILAFLYFRRHRRTAGLNIEQFWNLMLAVAVGTIVGAVLFYFFLFGGGPEGNLRYIARTHQLRGGAFIGACWGAFAAIRLYGRRIKKPIAKLADLLGGAAPLALALMRIGCLMQGCCHGLPTPYPFFPFAVTFLHPRAAVRDSLLGIPLYPTQVYASLTALAIFLIAHFGVFDWVKRGKLPAGSVFLSSTVLYFTTRFFMEFIRGKDPGIFRPWGMTTNQFFAVVSILGAIALFRSWRKKR